MSGMSGYPKKPVPPSCADCGSSRCTPVRKPGISDAQIASNGGMGAFDWLCGDCLYKREHPEAEAAIKMPWERKPKKLQAEKLF